MLWVTLMAATTGTKMVDCSDAQRAELMVAWMVDSMVDTMVVMTVAAKDAWMAGYWVVR